MRILRWIVVRLLAAWLWLCLTLIAITAILLATVLNPSFIKTTLDKSGLFDTIVASGLKMASINLNAKDDNDISGIIADLTPSAEKVLTPQLLQTNINKVIDGFGDWLKGKTPVPQFTIDTAEIKDNLNTALAAFLSQRVAALPACPINNDVPSYDLITTDCRPPVTLNQSDYVNAANDFTKDIPALDKAAISSAEIIKNTNDEVWQTIPNYYHLASFVPYIFALLAAVAAGFILLISRKRSHALRKIGHVFIANGAILLVMGAIITIYFGRNSMDFIVNGSTVEQANFIKETVIPLIHHLAGSLGSWLLYFGAGYAVLGAGCYVGAHFWRLRQKRAAEAPDEHLTSPPSDSPFDKEVTPPEPILPPEVTPPQIAEPLPPGPPRPPKPPRPKPPLIQ